MVFEGFNFLSAFFSMWLLGGVNWYLMFMIVIVIFKAADVSLSIKWKGGTIPRIFKPLVHYVKALIIYLSPLLFIALVRMALQSYTYITCMYFFPFLMWWGNAHIDLSNFPFFLYARVHRCEKHYIFCSCIPGMYQEVSLWLIVALVFLCAGDWLLRSLIFQDGSW